MEELAGQAVARFGRRRAAVADTGVALAAFALAAVAAAQHMVMAPAAAAAALFRAVFRRSSALGLKWGRRLTDVVEETHIELRI